LTLNKELCFIRANKTKFGGAEVYLSRLSDALRKQNIKHSVLHSKLPKFLPSWFRAILFNMQVCLAKKNRLYFSLDRISCPDIYRAGDGVHKIFLTAEKKSKFNPLHPVYLSLEKRCFQKSKRIIANSEMIKDQIINTYNISSEKISVVYNGIVLKEANYQKSFNKISNEFLIKEDCFVLLYVGSGFKRKGVSEFLQIIANLRTPNIRAFIVGKERNIEYYQQLAVELKIDRQVEFTGPREDVDDFYTISDIFILPTHYEPFSNVILEAMSFNNVVFTTRQNGASEILDNKFIMNNPQDFSVTHEIDQLLSNKKMLKAAQNSNRLKSEQFSIEKNLTKTLKVIDEVVN